MPARKLPPTEKLIALYKGGMSAYQIASLFDAWPSSVHRQLRKEGATRNIKEASQLRDEKGRHRPGRYWQGKKQPHEMIEARISKIRGKRHYIWKGGIDLRPYRRLVEKDKCQECGATANLVVHHRDLDHYNDVIENLQVLCNGCHSSLHKRLYWEAQRQRSRGGRCAS